MERVYENGGDLKKTINVVEKTEDGGSVVRWLEDGKLGSAAGKSTWIYDEGGKGWIHIRNNHIIHPSGNQFVQKFGSEFTDEEKIKDLILTSIKNGISEKKTDNLGRISYIYNTEIQSGKYLRTVVNEAGEIITSYPI